MDSLFGSYFCFLEFLSNTTSITTRAVQNISKYQFCFAIKSLTVEGDTCIENVHVNKWITLGQEGYTC